jgi:transcriptional regulator with GAF, ATPase, and Fis domain/CHASE2 domain-containing sensor protein
MITEDKQKIYCAAGVVFIFILLYVLHFPWNKVIENGTINLHLQLRGERESTPDIILIYIGEEDIQALGGWPITRDYYSYIIHILNQKGVKTIGFDLLFDRPDGTYPEYDTTLAYFLHQRNNIVLPFVFNEVVQNESNLPVVGEAIFPIGILKKNAKYMGYSNLGEQATIPLMMEFGDTLVASLGFELARHFLNLSDSKIELIEDQIVLCTNHSEVARFPLNLSLNYLGSGQMFHALSIIDLFQLYQQNPDSLNFRNKLALIAVISPGRCSLRPTPLAAALPASLIHLTVAENLIEGTYIRPLPKYAGAFIIIFLCALSLFISSGRGLVIQTAATIPLYSLFTVIVFNGFNLMLPLFYPLAAQLSVVIVLMFLNWKRSQFKSDSQRMLLQNQLAAKQKQYEELEEKIDSLESVLDREKGSALRNDTLVKEIRELEKQIRDLQEYTKVKRPLVFREFPDIIYEPNSRMERILELVAKVSSDTIPVLILGETGTGKEVIARAIHLRGKRRQAPFIAVNCGALPDTLLESELFGHEKGSFTGAAGMRRGRFETAHKGTLFLDEVTETSTAFQVKLLRVLQEGTFERLGGEKSIRVDVRIIAASSRAITDELKHGSFREDLYYRLNGFPIQLPALRDRTDDIPPLALHFIRKHGYHAVKGFSKEAMTTMQNYSWPGNIRELENSVRRCAILVQSEGRSLVQVQDLPQELKCESKVTSNYRSLEEQILELLRSLKFSHAAISKTAKALGNRDRGTVTEYFRGSCFEYFVANSFNLSQTIAEIAGSREEEIIKRVEAKVRGYLKNIYQTCHTSERESLFKGLPKKYHSYLQQVIDYCRTMEEQMAKQVFTEL